MGEMSVAACGGLERLDKHEQVVWCQKKEGRQVDFFFSATSLKLLCSHPAAFVF
jgi:hypothetical protein